MPVGDALQNAVDKPHLTEVLPQFHPIPNDVIPSQTISSCTRAQSGFVKRT